MWAKNSVELLVCSGIETNNLKEQCGQYCVKHYYSYRFEEGAVG
jgi:hypothetical protein